MTSEAPKPLQSLSQILSRVADERPDKVGLVTKTRSLTFRELNDESSRLASSLARVGVSPGDRVTLIGQNRWEWVVGYHAVLKVGGVVNPANVMLTAEELQFLLRDAGTSVLMASADRLKDFVAGAIDAPRLEHVICFDEADVDVLSFAQLVADGDPDFEPVDVDSSELACIAYTSGTTGHPKGAMQSHLSLVLNCALTVAMHSRTSDDVVVSPLPCPHVYGNVVINGTWMVGGTVVLMERFDPNAALELVGRYNASLFEGVPAMYALMLDSPTIDDAQLSTLTRSTVGGQTISESVIEAWESRTGAPLVELWGMTELSGLGTTHALHAPKVNGSIGVALPGIEVRAISMENGRDEVAAGEHGELVVRGPIVMMGYYNNPEATAAAIDADGWLHTGDVATHDGLGHFFIVDRLKDMILTGGYNVYPAEIERVLIDHPTVALVAVGRETDRVKGEVAHAYVVPAASATIDPDQLLAYCRTRLAAYKVPKAVHIVSALPTTSSGKLMRRKLGTVQQP